MSEEPSVVPSIGGVFLRPMPMLLGDCEEQEEEDTRRPRRVSASVNLGDFTRIILRTYEVTKLRSYEVTKEGELHERSNLLKTSSNICPIQVQYRAYQQLFLVPVFRRISFPLPTLL